MHPKIFGIDFSGAQNAGEKIWVARATQDENGLRFDLLARVADFDNSDEPSRDSALSALVLWLQHELSANSRAGFDFPFALTAENLGDNSWRDWIYSLEKFQNADEFRAAFHDGKRACDLSAKTPFSPLNLRLYRQTFHGMRDVLRPLLKSGAVAVPFENRSNDTPILLEICPASLLKREKLYLSYKGKSESQRENRALIFDGLRNKTGFEAPPEIETACLQDSEGDALDAVIAALCVARNSDFDARNELEKLEGRVFF